jgi:tetratricopeptide (TPR) repeat protein
VATWQNRYFIPASQTGRVGLAFTGDGSRMALSTSEHEIMLADPADGREIVRLSTLPTLGAIPSVFSADGGTLVATASPDTVLIWDLRELRERLAELSLDWDDAPLPRRGTVSPAPSPLRITVNSGEVLARLESQRRKREAAERAKIARAHVAAGRWKEAIEELEQSLALNPADAMSLNNFAWYLATCPDPELRDPSRAVEFARMAVAAAPDEASYRNTLGVCLYRAGDWNRAIDELLRAEQLAPQQYFVENALFLSMTYCRRGEPDAARSWYDQAVAWLEKHGKGQDSELMRFRAEADEVLGGHAK